MNERFSGLKKIPNEPAMRMLAMANAKLKTPLNSPANASVSTVLDELEKAESVVDMLRLISIVLPARERAWWACLAARDVIGPDVEDLPPPLASAEKWVRKPSDETRDAVRAALDAADVDDNTTLCATTVIFFDGKLGTGELSKMDAPPGAAEAAAFGMNVMAISKVENDPIGAANHLIDRALDIARGGTGRLDNKEGE